MSSSGKMFHESIMAITSNAAYGAHPNRTNGSPSIQKLLLLSIQFMKICHTRSPKYQLSTSISCLVHDAYVIDSTRNFWKYCSNGIYHCLQIPRMLLSHKVSLTNIFGFAYNITNIIPPWLNQVALIHCASYYIIHQRLLHPIILTSRIQSRYRWLQTSTYIKYKQPQCQKAIHLFY